jgi:outer membrane protein OmpA-like peptidoglycan-associated protein
MNLSIKTMVVGAATAFALSACTTVSSIDRVAEMGSSGNAFTDGLHAGYVELAYKEAGFYDWIDAGFFRDKAEAAGMGEVVLPEDPNAWSIDDEAQLAELNAERARLIGVLDDGARSENPDLAAVAQTSFDCWVEEAEEGPEHNGPVAAHQVRELGKCRADYLTAMEALTAPVVEEVVMVEETPTATEFIVYFGWDVADLSPLAQSFLNDVAAEAAAQNPALISVGGYTDTSGSAEYNIKLSERRANNVAAYLAGQGVDSSIMDVRWFGEEDLAVPTGDNVREPNNRRVEITFE